MTTQRSFDGERREHDSSTLRKSKCVRIKTLASLCVLSGAFCTNAQGEVVSADLNLFSVTAKNTKNGFVCTAVVNNQNDDSAIDPRVIVLTPLQAPDILSMSVTNEAGTPVGKCTKGPLDNGFRGYAVCSLDNVLDPGVNVRRTITITTLPSTADRTLYPSTCSAFVYSGRGDINKGNNYVHATAP